VITSAAGVFFDRLINKTADICKNRDSVESLFGFSMSQAKNRCVKKNFATAELPLNPEKVLFADILDAKNPIIQTLQR